MTMAMPMVMLMLMAMAMAMHDDDDGGAYCLSVVDVQFAAGSAAGEWRVLLASPWLISL